MKGKRGITLIALIITIIVMLTLVEVTINVAINGGLFKTAKSTTGNVTGIYDMSGGTWEYVAGYVNNGNSSLTTYENFLYTADAKYKDVYDKGSSDDSNSNYTALWYQDYSSFPFMAYPFFGCGAPVLMRPLPICSVSTSPMAVTATLCYVRSCSRLDHSLLLSPISHIGLTTVRELLLKLAKSNFGVSCVVRKFSEEYLKNNFVFELKQKNYYDKLRIK